MRVVVRLADGGQLAQPLPGPPVDGVPEPEPRDYVVVLVRAMAPERREGAVWWVE